MSVPESPPYTNTSVPVVPPTKVSDGQRVRHPVDARNNTRAAIGNKVGRIHLDVLAYVEQFFLETIGGKSDGPRSGPAGACHGPDHAVARPCSAPCRLQSDAA